MGEDYAGTSPILIVRSFQALASLAAPGPPPQMNSTPAASSASHANPIGGLYSPGPAVEIGRPGAWRQPSCAFTMKCLRCKLAVAGDWSRAVRRLEGRSCGGE